MILLWIAVGFGLCIVGLFLWFEYGAYCWSDMYKEKTFTGFMKFIWRQLCD